MKKYIITLIFIIFGITSYASEENKVSLITCGQGNDIYTLFGHTAIRFNNDKQDIIFNYGVFDFSSENFMLRFALGETDYQLAVADYKYFINSYRREKRNVREQILNLTEKEKEKLWNNLAENYKPENRIYRYNFFYDNCATRPYEIIKKSINGNIVFENNINDTIKDVTFRSIIDKYSQKYPWYEFAMNYCLGSEADKPITRKETFFVPFYLEKAFQNAYIIDKKGEKRKLVEKETKILTFKERNNKENPVTPSLVGIAILVITSTISIWGLKQQKSLWIMDTIMLIVMGIMGIVPFFLMFFSTHPAVNPNYILLAINPMYLIIAPIIAKNIKNKENSYTYNAVVAILIAFIAFFAIIPQKIDILVLSLALSLLIRGISHIILSRKKR